MDIQKKLYAVLNEVMIMEIIKREAIRFSDREQLSYNMMTACMEGLIRNATDPNLVELATKICDNLYDLGLYFEEDM